MKKMNKWLLGTALAVNFALPSGATSHGGLGAGEHALNGVAIHDILKAEPASIKMLQEVLTDTTKRKVVFYQLFVAALKDTQNKFKSGALDKKALEQDAKANGSWFKTEEEDSKGQKKAILNMFGEDTNETKDIAYLGTGSLKENLEADLKDVSQTLLNYVLNRLLQRGRCGGDDGNPLQAAMDTLVEDLQSYKGRLENVTKMDSSKSLSDHKDTVVEALKTITLFATNALYDASHPSVADIILAPLADQTGEMLIKGTKKDQKETLKDFLTQWGKQLSSLHSKENSQDQIKKMGVSKGDFANLISTDTTKETPLSQAADKLKAALTPTG